MRNFLSKSKYRNFLMFSVLSVLLFGLFVILILGNNYIKSDNRVTDGYHQIYGIQMTEIEDEDAPQGVVKEYRFVLDDFHTNANCMAFYIVHQYARVYIDGKMVYEYYPVKESNVGNTLGCTWIIVPLVHDDSNKEIIIELTPVYKDILDNEIRFFHGAQYDIFIDILINNIIWFFISLACLSVGVLLICTHIHSKYHHKANNKSLVYLGLVAVLISFWKLFDMDLAPLLFEGNPRLLFYISYISLILVPLPLTKYVDSLLKQRNNNLLSYTYIGYFAVVTLLLILQYFSFFDLRSNISLILSLIVIVIVTLLITVVFKGDFQNVKKDNIKDILPLLLAILSSGGILDIIIYFTTSSTDDLVFTFISFFVYSLIIVVHSLSENDKRNYRDFQTGLYNSNSCKEYLDDNSKVDNCCVMMIDLNGLKYTNDNYGHAAGDRLILDLTEILKKSIPINDFIGRYGGDEFIAIINHCDQGKIDRITESLEYYKNECNEDRMPKLSFAYGYALSSESEGDLSDLLKIADERMYAQKEEHYKNQ